MSRASSEDIAEYLCRIARNGGNAVTAEDEREVEEMLYWLKCAADNKYNNDYFRTFYRLLQNIAG